jgi:CTP-dependent riboflavin kinase
MKKKKVTLSPSQLKLETATSQEIFNELAKLMIYNKNRNSATRTDVEKHFRCTSNKATRILKKMVTEGRLTKDRKSQGLFWLVTG